MDDRKKDEVVQMFQANTRWVPSRYEWKKPPGGVRIRGSNNSVQITLAERAASTADEGLAKRRLIAQTLAHAGRVGARSLLNDWLNREFGTGLLSRLSLPELRQAHRQVSGWTSPIG